VAGSGGAGGVAGSGGADASPDRGGDSMEMEVPPAAPSGLVATPGDAQVSLTWAAASGATSYNVKRGTSSNGPFATVASAVAVTSYLDEGLSNGTSYHYVVSASNGRGESPSSGPASATPAPTWSSADIGMVGLAGRSIQTGAAFSVTGAGADIYTTADAFQYLSRSVMGDATISARVASIENVNVWSKAAVMMRAGLAADASTVVALTSPTASNGYRLQARVAAGGDTSTERVSAGSNPTWLRLVRRGNAVTGFFSADGVTWSPLGTAKTVTWPAVITIGLAVTSHDTTRTATAVFDNVTVTTP
jgi:hypothetical protein